MAQPDPSHMIDGRGFTIRSPKRDKSSNTGRAAWYPYYAGYSPSFVEDSIDFAQGVGPVSCILDPWNGSGTTPQVAQSRRIPADGFDLNPAMVLVAKAKTLPSNVRGSLLSLLDDICLKANTLHGASSDDPLTAWVSEHSAGAIRSIDKAIFMLLVKSTGYTPIGKLQSLADISALASFFYLALFRSFRTVLKPFVGSNPTWIWRPHTKDRLLDIPCGDITNSFREQLLSIYATLATESTVNPSASEVTSSVDIARSGNLPLADATFDLVVSSPPYCTRIDYAVKTSPELAVLGIDQRSFRSMRDEMIGTPTIADTPASSSAEWGVSCERLLDCISCHPARASRSYYWKTYVQYFSGLFRSLKEIKRVLRMSGLCFLVVQDSYYKELHVDLARITDEMATGLGFELNQRFDFETSRAMVGLNTASRGYNNAQVHTESVLVWKRM
jgi:hypothetical protein